MSADQQPPKAFYHLSTTFGSIKTKGSMVSEAELRLEHQALGLKDSFEEVRDRMLLAGSLVLLQGDLTTQRRGSSKGQASSAKAAVIESTLRQQAAILVGIGKQLERIVELLEMSVSAR